MAIYNFHCGSSSETLNSQKLENQTSADAINDNLIGWWEDKLLLLSDSDTYTIYNLNDDLSINLPIKFRYLYLKEEE